MGGGSLPAREQSNESKKLLKLTQTLLCRCRRQINLVEGLSERESSDCSVRSFNE